MSTAEGQGQRSPAEVRGCLCSHPPWGAAARVLPSPGLFAGGRTGAVPARQTDAPKHPESLHVPVLLFPVLQRFPPGRSFLPPLECSAERVPARWHSGVLAHGWRGKSQPQHRGEDSFHRGYSLACPNPMGCMAHTPGLPWPPVSPTATDCCSPTGLPKTLPPPQNRPAAPRTPCCLTKAGGGPRASRGGSPRSPEFPGAGIRAGSRVEAQICARYCLHRLAWAGHAPLKVHPPNPALCS